MGQGAAILGQLLWSSLLSILVSFSYGWFNTALMLECRSYLPWLTNRWVLSPAAALPWLIWRAQQGSWPLGKWANNGWRVFKNCWEDHGCLLQGATSRTYSVHQLQALIWMVHWLLCASNRWTRSSRLAQRGVKFFHRKVESFEEVSWGCGEHEAGISAAEGAVRLSPPRSTVLQQNLGLVGSQDAVKHQQYSFALSCKHFPCLYTWEPCWGSYALAPALLFYSLPECWTKCLAWCWCRSLVLPGVASLSACCTLHFCLLVDVFPGNWRCHKLHWDPCWGAAARPSSAACPWADHQGEAATCPACIPCPACHPLSPSCFLPPGPGPMGEALHYHSWHGVRDLQLTLRHTRVGSSEPGASNDLLSEQPPALLPVDICTQALPSLPLSLTVEQSSGSSSARQSPASSTSPALASLWELS